MQFHVCTLFPEMFNGFLTSSIMKRAHQQEIVNTNLINFREFATDAHKTVDDTPYGGGGGMLLKPEPIFAAVESINGYDQMPIILLTPQGRPFKQSKARELATYKQLILICGRYEGFDERIREHLATEELSVGDYVLTGGELPAMIVIDTVTRLLDGVLGNSSSASTDSFGLQNLLECPQYTKPYQFREYSVPEILLSGNHAAIDKWRDQQALKRTKERRPDLL